MPKPRSADAKPFYQAAFQRLEDARVLLDNGRTTGAVYLAGYGVECVLKALLVERTPRSRRAAVLALFRGQLAHNFDWLVHELNRTGFSLLRRISVLFVQVSDWSTDLRYSGKKETHRAARSFFEDAKQIVQWIERQM